MCIYRGIDLKQFLETDISVKCLKKVSCLKKMNKTYMRVHCMALLIRCCQLSLIESPETCLCKNIILGDGFCFNLAHKVKGLAHNIALCKFGLYGYSPSVLVLFCLFIVVFSEENESTSNNDIISQALFAGSVSSIISAVSGDVWLVPCGRMFS